MNKCIRQQNNNIHNKHHSIVLRVVKKPTCAECLRAMIKCMVYFIVFFPIISYGQVITTWAGGGTGGPGDGGPATNANITNPARGIFDRNGNFYIVSGTGHRVRKISVDGTISTVAGTGTSGYNGDGIPATNARLNLPTSVVVDTFGNLYIADGQNERIRKVDAVTGLISTIAGTGVSGFYGDGIPATDAHFDGPGDLCFDKRGNLYSTDYSNNRIRKISTSGIITTFAGNGISGYSGDGSKVDTARIGGIGGMCCDDTGNIYLADIGLARVFKIDTFGIITTVAGTSTGYLYNGDGIPATNANIHPSDVDVDNGILYVSEHLNYRVRKIDASGIIHTVAGIGTSGTTGDLGLATSAQINYPSGIEFDVCGNLYISEANARRIRKVIFNGTGTPTITVTSVTTATLGSTVTVNAIVSGAGSSYIIKWFKNATLFNTTTVPTTTYTKGAGTDVITARVVPSMLTCYDSATSAGHTITQQTVGLSSVKLAEFQIYPNPVGGILVISGTEAINNVAVTDIMGRVIATLPKVSDKENQVELHLGHLPKGVYFIKVNDLYVQRFLKE